MIDLLKFIKSPEFENNLPSNVNVAVDISIIGRSGYFEKWYDENFLLVSDFYPGPKNLPQTATRYFGVVRGINYTSIFVEETKTGKIYHLPFTCFTFIVQ